MKEKTAGQGNGKPVQESENDSDLKKSIHSWKDLSEVTWQVPLLGFIIYFTYFYLDKGFWIFVFSMGTWFFLSGIWTSFNELFTNLTAEGEKRWLKKITRDN